MFLPYRSDVYPEYRPWLAYLGFPVLVFLTFDMIRTETFPEMNQIFFISIEVSSLVLFLYLLWSVAVLWTLGNALCMKIGNLLYMAWLLILFGLYAVFVALETRFRPYSVMVWFLSWIINGIAGAYLVLCPEHSIDCIIMFLPPFFRRISMTGFWFVAFWLLADILLSLFLGWYWNCLFSLAVFGLGMLYIGLLQKINVIQSHPAERSLWQVLKKIHPEDRYWQSSWSVRKQQERNEESLELKDFSIKTETPDTDLNEQKEKPILPMKQNNLAILCQCGQIVYIPAESNKKTPCPSCGRFIQPPKTSESNIQ